MPKRPNSSDHSPNWIIPLILIAITIASGAALLIRLTRFSPAGRAGYLTNLYQSIPHLIDSLPASLSNLELLSHRSDQPPAPLYPTDNSATPTLTPTPTPTPHLNLTPTKPLRRQPPPTISVPTLTPFDSAKPWPDINPGELGSAEWQQEFTRQYQAIKQEIETNRQQVIEQNRQFTDQLTASPFPTFSP